MLSAAPTGMDLVSITLPTHNGERYIQHSIESCLDQSYRNWELVIVDDGSTDGTAGKIARYTDRRIRVIRHATRRGLAAALNTGFSVARGAFLSWTSDDNCYRAAALERMLTFLSGRPDVDFVYADNEMVDDAGAPKAYFQVQPPECLLHENYIGACFLYRRRVYEAVGPYAEGAALAEDYDYWLRVSISFQMAPLNEALYCYRIHPHSLTSRVARQSVRAAMRKSLLRYLRAIPWADDRTKASACLGEARRAALEGRIADVVRCLALGFGLAPGWTASHAAGRLGRLVSGSRSRSAG